MNHLLHKPLLSEADRAVHDAIANSLAPVLIELETKGVLKQSDFDDIVQRTTTAAHRELIAHFKGPRSTTFGFLDEGATFINKTGMVFVKTGNHTAVSTTTGSCNNLQYDEVVTYDPYLETPL